MVDNTFCHAHQPEPAGPGGRDLVLHSATKFLGGHADALGGVAAGSRELISKINSYREIVGNVLHPMAAYLLIRGMKNPEPPH